MSFECIIVKVNIQQSALAVVVTPLCKLKYKTGKDSQLKSHFKYIMLIYNK